MRNDLLPQEAKQTLLEKQRRVKELRRKIERVKNREWWSYRLDPTEWVSDRLGEHPWSAQRRILESVRDNRRTVVQACHGVGKSFIASRAIAWWIDTHPLGDAFVISTAPTFNQVRAILWREIGKAHRKAELPGKIVGGTEWKLGNGELVGFGRKPADHNEHGFQGIHAPAVLIVIDEACGVPKQLWDAAKAIATNDRCRILAIGNPDDPASEMARVCQPGTGWNPIRIDALASPNVTPDTITEACDKLGVSERVRDDLLAQVPDGWDGEQVPDTVRPMLTSAEWVVEAARDWGIGSPLWTSKVRGLFPEQAEDTLISWSAIRRAQQRTAEPQVGDVKYLTVDVARYGRDRTIFGLRHGPSFRVVADYAKQDTMETTGKAVMQIRAESPTEVRVDGVGVGAGVVDRLGELELGCRVVDLQAGGAAQEPSRFHNARSEWWWQLRQAFEEDAIDIDPDDDDLANQLGTLKYEVTSAGKIKAESKDDMRGRGLPSPDRADTAMMAWAVHDGAPEPEIFV